MSPLKTVIILSHLITMLGLVITKPAEQTITTSEQGDDKTGVAVLAYSPTPISFQCSGSTSSKCKGKVEQTVDRNKQDEEQIEQKRQNVDEGDEGQMECRTDKKQHTVDKDDKQTETQTEKNVHKDDEGQMECRTDKKQHTVDK